MFQLPTINSTCPNEIKAALWATEVKKNYWKGTLEQYKIDVLNKVDGWTWCPIEGETWEMFGFNERNAEAKKN